MMIKMLMGVGRGVPPPQAERCSFTAAHVGKRVKFNHRAQKEKPKRVKYRLQLFKNNKIG